MKLDQLEKMEISREHATRIVSLLTIVIGLVLAASCIEPYTLEGINQDPDFVVVDGFIDATEGNATVKLTRAIALDGGKRYPAIKNAIVTIESETGERIVLPQVNLDQYPGYDTGTYQAFQLDVAPDKRYRLDIALDRGMGKHYQSDFITIQKAAPIESVEWVPAEEELKIFVNTAETAGTSQFYRWRYEEAWEYNSPLYSLYFMGEDREVKYRDFGDQIYTCYRQSPSFEILIGSSENLSSNVIRNYQLKGITRSSVNLTRLYAINVKQYGLSEEAYTYWLNLYKTTENTGGLFDPMPGQIFGNIKCVTNPAERVIGFFSGSTVEQQRLFIYRSELPDRYSTFRHPLCTIDTIFNQELPLISPGTLFYTQVTNEMGAVIGYTIAPTSCLDCRRFAGGTTTKPDYWPR